MEICSVIMAAGKGSRMKSKTPKVLCNLLFKPLIDWVIDSAKESGINEICTIVGHGREEVMAHLKDSVEYAVQAEQLGTGHAIMMCEDFLKKNLGKVVIVLSGDTPLIESETLKILSAHHIKNGSSVTVLTAIVENPTGYGRVVRDDYGNILKIVEQKDATEAEQAICEINSGIYAFSVEHLLLAIEKLGNNNAAGEYYLTDTIEILKNMGKPSRCMAVSSPNQVMGINDRAQLYDAGVIAKEKIFAKLMANGVTIYDKASTIISPDVKIGSECEILPSTIIKGKTVIGNECVVGPNTQIEDCQIGNGTKVNSSVLIGSIIGNNVSIGPFAYIRPNCKVADKAKIGDFVEIKNSTIGYNTKLSHLTYAGDCDLGDNVNLGCGVVTVNYNGFRKSRTVVEDNCFVGCNSNLVAPVRIKEDSYVAAGSTITDEVPEGALAIARARQINKNGWKKKWEEEKSDKSR